MARRHAGRSVLVTGAGGYLGRLLLERLAGAEGRPERIVGLDLRPLGQAPPGVLGVEADVRSPALAGLLREHAVDTVVHLAFVVTPVRGTTRADQHAVDVEGTRHVLEACAAAGVRRLVVTSSGAAYGYHADNPVPLRETDPLRGNESFAYAHHKRLVEEMLEVHRREHPELEQLVFRVCTVLGARTSNQITALFERPVVLDVAGGTAPFCFVWDEDLVDLLVRGVLEGRSGVYNVSGDGTLSMGEIARVLGKPHVAVSERALALALGVLSRLGLSPYGPEQTLFLKHRPVLANDRLASDFGAAPRHSTEAAFRRFAESRGLVRPAARALAGHTVVVSGAAGGIGRALAWRFGRGGARVALLDLDGAGVAAEARALARAGYSSLGLACDVTDPDACAKAIAEVSERLGGVDVLVANAGVSHRSLFLETELPVYRRVMDVNFFGALHLVKAAQEALLRTRGRIVAISSVAGFAPLLGRSGYCASKHALQGFFGTLRAELASRGVGVLVVCPGFTATGIERHALDGRGAPALRPQSRVGRQARPEDVADAVYHALRRGRRELVLTPVGRVSRGLMRLSPRLYERLMTRSLRVELARPPDAGRAP